MWKQKSKKPLKHSKIKLNSSCLMISTSYTAPEKRGFEIPIFLSIQQNICCEYSLEASPWDASNEHHNKWVCCKIRKKWPFCVGKKMMKQGQWKQQMFYSCQWHFSLLVPVHHYFLIIHQKHKFANSLDPDQDRTMSVLIWIKPLDTLKFVTVVLK